MPGTHPTTIDSLVLFRNSRDVEGRGTLVQVSRSMVVCEVYNPYSIVQLGEVLSDLQIRRGERVIYRGRAVVSNLMSTGVLVIASVTLLDPWSELAELEPGPALREQVGAFVDEWEMRFSSLELPYQAIVGKLANFCQELSRWLTHSEVTVEMDTGGGVISGREAFLHDVSSQSLPKLKQILREFEERARAVPSATLPAHKEFVRREVHPLIMCSPFVHRTFTKPLGYAGDYEMVNMMFRDPWEGRSTYARIVNAALIQTETAQGHRNRIARLVEYVEQEAACGTAAGRPVRILNIGCGPAIEIQRFIRQSPHAERCQFDLVDFNQQTLDYARWAIDEAVHQSGHRPQARMILESIHGLLKRATRPDAGRHAGQIPAILQTPGEYDLIYCAGLFDYLSDRICRRLLTLFFQALAPGGLMVATNVHPSNPIRQFMEHVLDWNLVHRDQPAMLDLAPAGGVAEVTAEPTGSNLFLEVRRPML